MTEYIDHTQEPDEAFTAVLAEFEAAPTPPEVLREQVAQAAWEASDDHEDDPSVEWENNYARDEWYRIADAALAVFRGQQDPAVQRVLALAESWRYKGEYGWGAWQEGHGPDQEGHILDRAAADIRAAIGGDGR